jgi:hypothetical protein
MLGMPLGIWRHVRARNIRNKAEITPRITDISIGLFCNRRLFKEFGIAFFCIKFKTTLFMELFDIKNYEEFTSIKLLKIFDIL